MKKHQLYFVILAIMATTVFSGCEGLAELAHGPKPEPPLVTSAATYTVTYSINGGSGTVPAARTASPGSTITLPSGNGLTRNGYMFGGWNTNSSGTGTNYTSGSSYTVTGNVTLYARWIAAGTTTYTVTFNINSGSGTTPAARTASPGSTITLPSGSGLTRTDYTFVGWNTNAAGTGTNYGAGSSYTVTGNVTLYARWIATGTTTYTVTFDINSGSGLTPIAETASSGSSITLPSGSWLTRTDYTFGGWNTNASGTGTNYSAGFSYTVTGNVTLYAKWDPVTDVPGATLAAKLSWLQTNAVSNVDYTVEVTANESISPTTLSYSGRTNISITLRGTGAVRTVSLSSTGAMFAVRDGVTLVLDNNITLQGRSDNTMSLVEVGVGGSLVMNAGSTVTGNTSSGWGGGGVFVDGGEYVFGTFTMNGGKISGNTTTTFGGGVFVVGTFTMNGGEISGNTSPSWGGGVYVNGTFTKTGGTIYGYSASDTVNSNVVKDSSGAVQSDQGHAVYVSSSKRRETTAGPSVNMDSRVAGSAGGWEGEEPSYGLQEDGSYILDPKEFKIWYGAIKNENAISFTLTHGGVYYNYPTDEGFDISNYESLVITYTCVIDRVGTDDNGNAGAKITVKVFNATLGSGGYYGTDIAYSEALSTSGGTLMIDDSILTDGRSWGTDVQGNNGSLGFAIAQSGDGTSDMFTITFTSITFIPGS